MEISSPCRRQGCALCRWKTTDMRTGDVFAKSRPHVYESSMLNMLSINLTTAAPVQCIQYQSFIHLPRHGCDPWAWATCKGQSEKQNKTRGAAVAGVEREQWASVGWYWGNENKVVLSFRFFPHSLWLCSLSYLPLLSCGPWGGHKS
jgi:hypothetical protein